MSKRRNIATAEKTPAAPDRVTAKTKRSWRKLLKVGYLANAEESLKIAEGWFPLEEEAWPISRATSTKGK